jgi:hypothetical protein
MNRAITTFLLAISYISVTAQNPVTVEKAGLMSAADKKKLDRLELVNSFSELRNVTNINAETTYRLLYNNTIGDFIYDAADKTSADDTAMTIVTASGKRLKRYVENFIDVRWFGANPAADGADDYPYIQKAIDWVLKYRTHGTVFIPAGDYILSKGLLIRKDENRDGASEFVSVDILGSKTASTTSSENGGETTLRCNDVTDFGIAVQRGKTMSIRNIAFSGKNLAGYKVSEYNVGDPNTSFLEAGCRNNRYSPYSAIVIDPFGTAAVLASNQYPKRAGLYTEKSKGGSSAISIENCFIRGFAVGICNSPNGVTQNAECHNFEHLWIDLCKSAIVNCNSQARTVFCRDIKVWGGVECVFDHQRYGDGTSSAMFIEDVNIAGSVKYIIATTNWGIGYYHQLNKVHAESVWAIGGDIVNGTQLGNISFKNSQIDLTGENGNSQQRAPIMAWCSLLDFQDSYIGYYSASDGSMMFCNAAMVIMRNTSGNIIHTQGVYEIGVFTELSVSNGDRPYYYTTDGSLFANEIRLRPGMEIYKNTYLNYTGNGLQMKQKYCGRAMNVYGLNGTFKPSSIELNTQKAVFKVGDQIYKCAPGANVVTQGKDDFGKTALVTVGIVTAVNVGAQTITVEKLSRRITASANISLYMFSPAKLYSSTAFYIGDLTKGANVISNIAGDYGGANSMKAGQYFNHPAFVPGTYITAATASSITLSTPALYSEKGAFVLNETNWENTGLGGETQATLNAYNNQTVFKEGDMIRLSNASISGSPDGSKLGYVCVKSGIFGTQRLPQFKAIAANGGGNIDDFSANADHVIPENASIVELHETLTINRKLTLPAALRTGQTVSVVLPRSQNKYRFQLTTPVIDNPTGNTVSFLDWGKTYDFYVSSAKQWLLIRKY